MASYTPGTYTGKGYGVRGKVILEVTFSEDRITDIKIVKHKEIYGQAYGLESSPFEYYIPKIIEHQSLAVPMVVGAEVVCGAIVHAVASCVEQAGGDADALKKVPVPFPRRSRTVRLTQMWSYSAAAWQDCPRRGSRRLRGQGCSGGKAGNRRRIFRNIRRQADCGRYPYAERAGNL